MKKIGQRTGRPLSVRPIPRLWKLHWLRFQSQRLHFGLVSPLAIIVASAIRMRDGVRIMWLQRLPHIAVTP